MSENQQGLAETASSRRLTTILVVDVCGFTKKSEIDDVAAIQSLDFLGEMITKLEKEYSGRLFNKAGDAFLIDFSSPQNGLQAALDLLAHLKTYNYKLSRFNKIMLKLGLHIGHVLDRPDGDILGHGVNIASRLQELAPVNQVLASSNIINLLENRDGFYLQKKGYANLKNVSSPVLTYAVSPEEIPIWQKTELFMVKYQSAIRLFLALLVLASSLYYLNFKIENNRLNQIEPAVISAGSLRHIRDNLQAAGIDDTEVVLELMRAKEIKGAITNLEQFHREGLRNNKFTFESKKSIELMLTIAFVSDHVDQRKAISWYKKVLRAEKANERAIDGIRRAENRTGDFVGNIDTEIDNVTNVNLTPEEKMRSEFNKIFKYLIKHDFETGAKKFEALEEDVKLLGNVAITLEWKTNLAIAYERMDKLDEAESLVEDVISKLELIGLNTNYPRANNVWGQILEKRAFDSNILSEKNKFIGQALSKYLIQHNYKGKPQEAAESSYYLGALYLYRARIESPINVVDNTNASNIERAKQFFNYGIWLSDEKNHDYTRHRLRNTIGLAVVYKREGKNNEACDLILRTNDELTNRGIMLRPRMLDLQAEAVSICT